MQGYAAPMNNRGPEPEDRPPICPACGVTMGIVVAKKGATRCVCLECGFRGDEK